MNQGETLNVAKVLALFQELSDRLASAQDCIDLLTMVYPAEQLLPRHKYLVEEVANRAHHASTQQE